MRHLERIGSLFVVASLFACVPSGTSAEDAGSPDAGSPDAGLTDAGSPDGGESGATDAGAYRPDGGRLQVHWRLGPNGDRDFVEFVDTQLATQCIFIRAFDGVSRCVPSGTRVVDFKKYLDGLCSVTPVIELAATAPLPGLILVADDAVCPLQYRAYSPGREVAQGMVFQRTTPNGRCFQVPTEPDRRYFELGAPLPLPDWIRGEIIETADSPPAGRDVVPATRVLVDGGVVRSFGLFDAANGVVCRDEAVGAEVRCMPQDFATTNGFTEGTCTQPAYGGAYSLCAATPRFGRDFAQPPSWVRLQQPPLGEIWWGTPGSCNASTPSEPEFVWWAGIAEPVSGFPLATLKNVGTGRLQRRHLVWPGGLETPTEWLDTQLGVECQSLGRATDATFRCFPVTSGVWSANLFADSQCTAPLASSTVGPPPSPAYVAIRDSVARTTRSYRVGATYSGATYRRTTAGCVAATPSGTVYGVGAELPPADLAPFDWVEVYE